MHNVLRDSYKSIGGYNDLGSGSKEESEAIHSDISNPNHHIQATIDRDKITSVIIKKFTTPRLICSRTQKISLGR